MKATHPIESLLRKSFVFNCFIILAKLTFGILGNSFALLADAIESASDVVASGIVWLGARYASRPADENHPYGHGRAEPLIAFVVVLFLIVSSLIIFYQSVINIRKPQESPEWWTIPVIAAIILAKELAFRIIHRASDRMHSTAGRAEAWHHRADAITSLATLSGVSIAVLLGGVFVVADEIAAMIAALFILYNAYKILRPALSEALDEHIHHELEEDIRRISKTVEGIIDTEKCYIRKTGFTYYVDLHAIVDGNITVKAGHELAHRLKDTLMHHLPNISDVLIHIEPYEP
ncbi:cation diffusion facilitator family transporter [Thermaurantimonas aggregans]|uniref:cation diffusion facilitator family transporter n=1 Tax=Thermaurantimonas aggregans TaxID=2173829 RepID=UPI001357B932|nr:cation diffusion facilitator family transporter [Thermaurantimonas aggregans]